MQDKLLDHDALTQLGLPVQFERAKAHQIIDGADNKEDVKFLAKYYYDMYLVEKHSKKQAIKFMAEQQLGL